MAIKGEYQYVLKRNRKISEQPIGLLKCESGPPPPISASLASQQASFLQVGCYNSPIPSI